LVLAAFRAAAERSPAVRFEAAVFACFESALGDRCVSLALQRAARGPRPGGRDALLALAARLEGALRAAAGLLGSASLLRRLELHAGAPRLGEADRDRLLGRSRPVLAFTDVVHLPAHELAGLRGWSLSLALVLFRAFDRFLLGHDLVVLPPVDARGSLGLEV
jgi:hypothetical protein